MLVNWRNHPKVKLGDTSEGFPVTSLREISILLRLRHPGIVFVREIVGGATLNHVKVFGVVLREVQVFCAARYVLHGTICGVEGFRWRFVRCVEGSKACQHVLLT